MLIESEPSGLHNYLVSFRPGWPAVFITGAPELPRRIRELAAIVLEDVCPSQVSKDRSYGLQSPKLATIDEALEIAQQVSQGTWRPAPLEPQSLAKALQASPIQGATDMGRLKKPVREGFWKSALEPDLPMPVARDDEHPSKARLLKALAFVESQADTEHYKGFSRCRICDCMNGSSEHTALGFTWPSGLSHYIREHNVRVTMAFRQRILSHAEESAAATDQSDSSTN